MDGGFQIKTPILHDSRLITDTMKYKLIAVDLDGTLVRNDHTISRFSTDILTKAQEKGVKVVICTGRPAYGARHITKAIRLEDFGGYVIGYNGGEIIDYSSGKVIRDLLLPDGIMPQAVKFADIAGADLMTFCDGQIISTSAMNPIVQRSSVRNKMEIVKVDDWINQTSNLRLHKCMLVGQPERLRAIESDVQSTFKGILEAFCSEPPFLELTPCGVNKGDGISWLLKHINMETSDVVAFGDTPGDSPMLQLAGMGVAMGNAPDFMKSAAGAVTLTNEEDGVAVMLEKMLEDA